LAKTTDPNVRSTKTEQRSVSINVDPRGRVSSTLGHGPIRFTNGVSDGVPPGDITPRAEFSSPKESPHSHGRSSRGTLQNVYAGVTSGPLLGGAFSTNGSPPKGAYSASGSPALLKTSGSPPNVGVSQNLS